MKTYIFQIYKVCAHRDIWISHISSHLLSVITSMFTLYTERNVLLEEKISGWIQLSCNELSEALLQKLFIGNFTYTVCVWGGGIRRGGEQSKTMKSLELGDGWWQRGRDRKGWEAEKKHTRIFRRVNPDAEKRKMERKSRIKTLEKRGNKQYVWVSEGEKGGIKRYTERAKEDWAPTTTVPDAEVEGSTGVRRDAEIHGAVIPSLISINRSQHLHHLKRRDRKSVEDWVRGGHTCVYVCVCRGGKQRAVRQKK